MSVPLFLYKGVEMKKYDWPKVLYVPFYKGNYLKNSKGKIRAYKTIRTLQKYTKFNEYDEILMVNTMTCLSNLLRIKKYVDMLSITEKRDGTKYIKLNTKAKRLIAKFNRQAVSLAKTMAKLGSAFGEFNITMKMADDAEVTK